MTHVLHAILRKHVIFRLSAERSHMIIRQNTLRIIDNPILRYGITVWQVLIYITVCDCNCSLVWNNIKFSPLLGANVSDKVQFTCQQVQC
jgi:hypothetical protein